MPYTPLLTITRIKRAKDIAALQVRVNGQLAGLITDSDIAIDAFADGHAVSGLTARDVKCERVVSEAIRRKWMMLRACWR